MSAQGNSVISFPRAVFGLPHDGAVRFGLGAGLLAFGVLREDLIPERRWAVLIKWIHSARQA